MTTLTSPSPPSLSPKSSYRSLARSRTSPLVSAIGSSQTSKLHQSTRSSPSPSFTAGGTGGAASAVAAGITTTRVFKTTASSPGSEPSRRQTASLSPSRNRHAGSRVVGRSSLSSTSSTSSTSITAAVVASLPITKAAGDGAGYRSSPVVKGPDASTADVGTQYTPPGYPPTAESRYAKKLRMEIEAGSGRAKEKARARPSEGGSEDSGEGASSSSGAAPQLPVVLNDVVGTATASTALSRQLAYATSAGGRSASDISTSSISSVALTNGEPSPQKRVRSAEEPVKVMPLDYARCDVKDLGILISDMLLELIRLNDRIPLKDGTLTRFHSRAPPTISVRDYLSRIIIHATLSPPLLLSMVYYIDRLCSLYPAFTISSLTVHRFLITAATVAAKGLSDSFWTNHTYARVGGVSTKELAMLELEFLGRLEWRIVPLPELLDDYYRSLVSRTSGYVLEGDDEDYDEEEKMQE